jgi:hypothetical protein
VLDVVPASAPNKRPRVPQLISARRLNLDDRRSEICGDPPGKSHGPPRDLAPFGTGKFDDGSPLQRGNRISLAHLDKLF